MTHPAIGDYHDLWDVAELTMSTQKTLIFTLLVIAVSAALVFFSVRSSFVSTEQAKAKADSNLFFIMIDTLRADHLGCYGYTRDTSPQLDRIAHHGIVFSNFYSVSNWTTPAIASLFTGLYPREIYGPGTIDDVLKEAIPAEVDTLAEVLQSAGHRTVALVTHPMIHPQLGFAQGFSEYRMLLKERLPLKKSPTHWIFSGDWDKYGLSVDELTKEVSTLLGQIAKTPFFVYLHVIYPHAPYIPPPPYKEMFGEPYRDVQWYSSIPRKEKEGLINAYDGEIRYTDTLIGNIFQDLKIRGLLESTYVVITSDHGEGFWEHGFYEHGHCFYDEVIKIPLVIYPPGGRPEPLRIDAPASNIDLFPTVTDLLGLDHPTAVHGNSLMRFVRPPIPPEDKSVLFSERPHSADLDAMALIHGHLKYISSPRLKRDFLFQLNADPEEKSNLAHSKRDVIKQMNALLLEHRETVDKKRASLRREHRQLDQQTQERLKSLGYLK